MGDFNWNAEATHAANELSLKCGESHRGTTAWRRDGITVVFGNDGYGTDDRAKSEVAKVREYLTENGIEELGFGTDTLSGESYTWAMLVRTSDCEPLEDAAWDGWLGGEAAGSYGLQRTIGKTGKLFSLFSDAS